MRNTQPVLYLMVGFAVLTLGGTALGEVVRWDDHPDGRTHCYELVNDDPTYWEDAVEKAASREHPNYPGLFGYLATITSEQENQFINDNLLGEDAAMWLGGFWVGPGDDQWTWSTTDEPWDYTNWYEPEEPSSPGAETYLMIWGTGVRRGFWNDEDYQPDNFYIVEWEIPEPTEVAIDIKPGSYPNAINLGSHGVVPVAILSSACFDATEVDAGTVNLGGAGVAVRGRGNRLLAHEEDVDGDGLLDLVVQVETENLDPGQLQDGFAILTGSTVGGDGFVGRDEITIVP